MNRLFEMFVSHYLEEYVDSMPNLRGGFRIDLQSQVHLNDIRDEEVRPDIVIKRGSRACAVLDAKHKTIKVRPENEDRRQMREYANILGLRDVWLVYSGGTASKPSRDYSSLQPFTLHTLIWNLDGPLDGFRERCMANASNLMTRAIADQLS